ncbi:MAG: penicillin-binding transpeptidase domain-containing protein [Verrucomicrobiota bacterium]
MVVRYRFRLYLLTLLTIAGFSALLVKLWSIQLKQGEYFRSIVPGTSELTVRVPGTRGEIKDVNGTPLVTNQASYEVIFNLKEIEDEYLRQHESLPKREYEVWMGGRKEKRPETDIVAIVFESVIEPLERLGLARKFKAESLRVHYRSTRGVVPYTYRRDLTFDEFARFAEFNLNLPGVSVAARPVRQYPYDSLACHVLGYVRLPDIKLVPEEERRSYDFYVGDDFGVHGIEKSMDATLQGEPGARVLLKSEKGAIVGEIEDKYRAPVAGADVYLTIDSRIQHITELALREAGVGRASAVVVDPQTGGILAMASVPSFNPNKFIPTIDAEAWKEYVSNPTHPLNNRSVQTFAPGSTYKIPASLAGCLAGIRGHSFYCAGGVTYGDKHMACWIGAKGGQHGSIRLGDAIKRSCNSFYYQFGNAAGINNILTMGKMLGLGQDSGLDITGESAGILPGPKWLRANQPGYNWTSSFTAMTSIGQGFTQASPLQMAMVTAAVANGGLVYKPRLVDRVVAKDGTVVMDNAPFLRHNLLQEGLSQKDMDTIRWGMWAVVNDGGGTASRARSTGWTISGKTGTAQAWRPDGQKDNNAWFIGFAPYEEAELSVCVMVQNGKSGGTVAAPIVKKIVEESLGLEKGYEHQIAAVEEASGNFDFFDYITFDLNPELIAALEDDPDAGNIAASFAPPPPSGGYVQSQTYAAPSLREAPDAEGSRVKQSSGGGFFKKLFGGSNSSSSSSSSSKKRGGFFNRSRGGR